MCCSTNAACSKSAKKVQQVSGAMQVLRAQNEQKSGSNWVVLDGCHTSQSAAALAETVRGLFPSSPVAVIAAMADDKDHRAVMSALRFMQPAVVVFTTVPIAGGMHR